MNTVKSIKDHYNNIRKLTEKICKPLKPEDYIPQPIEDVSPPKWHLGHTTWFFEVFILVPYKKDFKIYDKKFHFLFNSYYESMGDRIIRANRGNLSRPTIEEVYKYRNYIDQEMQEFLDSVGEPDRKLKLFLEIGINHEQQHQELLVYDLKYILGNNPLFPEYIKNNDQAEATKIQADWIPFDDPGLVQIGHDGKSFCFDNEMPEHKSYLHPFKISSRTVTNEEYLEFIESGAYKQFNHWLSDGWEWVKRNDIGAPLYWHKIDRDWYQYTLHGLEKIQLQESVSHVSFYEADAFARWKGMRLPTEAEWEHAAKSLEPDLPPEANLLNHWRLRPSGGSKYDFWGNVWEWTESAYLPYPGYKQDDGALGEYNGKFMVNQKVLKGGSFATPSDHIRLTYRNFFHTDKRWLISGIRLCKNI